MHHVAVQNNGAQTLVDQRCRSSLDALTLPGRHARSLAGNLSNLGSPCAPRRGQTVAVIPARGGSKGLPGKNLRTVGGVPLVVRAVQSCVAAGRLDATYVSTDDHAIALAAVRAGARVIARPAELAGDQASSESAVLDTLDQLESHGIRPTVVLLVQCTSPFIAPAELEPRCG